MDDRPFDQQTALDWIAGIEKTGRTIRDDDIYPMLNSWIQRNAPTSILDIGCGQGICSEKLLLDRAAYTGVDASPYMLARAIEVYGKENKTFHVGDAYSLPFSDQSFESAFSLLVWHLLEDIGKAAKELNRILKPNGHFLIMTANPSSYSGWISMYPNAKVSGKRLEGTMELTPGTHSHDVLHLHTLDDLNEALLNSGLKVQGSETFRASKADPQCKMLISIWGQKDT
jgi:SAM-dependent methyltransferase